MRLSLSLSLAGATLNKGGLAPPAGFAFVTRVRDGQTQYAVSPSRDGAYAVKRIA